MDSKEIVIREAFTLTDVACYKYVCGRCGTYEVMPQLVVKTFAILAPKEWCCVAQDESRMYFCSRCAREIGISV